MKYPEEIRRDSREHVLHKFLLGLSEENRAELRRCVYRVAENVKSGRVP